MTPRRVTAAAILAVALTAGSCGTQTYTQAVTTPVPDVVEPPIARITVLGVSGSPRWPIAPEVEAETRRLLAESLRVRNVAIAVSYPEKDRSLLEEAGLGSAWTTLTDVWLETGIADGPLLRDMADAVGADAVLGGLLLSDQEASGVGWGGDELPDPSVRVVAVRLWLFDARTGELLWEAAAESTTQVNQDFLTAVLSVLLSPEPEELPPVPLAEAVMRAVRDLATKLPRLGPPPMPARPPD